MEPQGTTHRSEVDCAALPDFHRPGVRGRARPPTSGRPRCQARLPRADSGILAPVVPPSWALPSVPRPCARGCPRRRQGIHPTPRPGRCLAESSLGWPPGRSRAWRPLTGLEHRVPFPARPGASALGTRCLLRSGREGSSRAPPGRPRTAEPQPRTADRRPRKRPAQGGSGRRSGSANKRCCHGNWLVSAAGGE